MIYCVKGSGWCDVAGRLTTVVKGDLLIIPSGWQHTCGPRPTDPWQFHWVEAAGMLLTEYLRELEVHQDARVIHVGDDPQLIRLFNEILQTLQRGTGLEQVLRASHTLTHLLAIVIEKSRDGVAVDADATRKVAEAIIYMSEHVEEPVRIAALARMASLSPAYFTGLFKQQTGCSPRDYLHLLRIHRACQLLSTTGLSIKEIASRVGYQDQFHFSRQFKSFQGVPPTEYRHGFV